MNWQTLLTSFAGALGGTATALLIAGTLSKGLLDQWLKKDFKRFESKLDAIAAKEEAKFNYLHPERAKIAKELYHMCNEMEQSFKLMLPGGMHSDHLDEYEVLGRQTELRLSFLKQAAALEVFTKENSIYFSAEVIAVISAFAGFAFRTFQDVVRGETIANPTVEFEDKLEAVEKAFRDLLASETTQ